MVRLVPGKRWSCGERMVLTADFTHLFKFPFDQVINAYFKKVCYSFHNYD